MASRYFDADEIVPQLRDHVAEQVIFADNSVRVSLRAHVRNLQVTFLIEYKDGAGESAYKVADTIEDAMKIAEDKQKV